MNSDCLFIQSLSVFRVYRQVENLSNKGLSHFFSLLDRRFISKLMKSIHIFRILNTHNYAKCIRKQNRVTRRCYKPRLRKPLLTAYSTTILNWIYESYWKCFQVFIILMYALKGSVCVQIKADCTDGDRITSELLIFQFSKKLRHFLNKIKSRLSGKVCIYVWTYDLKL